MQLIVYNLLLFFQTQSSYDLVVECFTESVPQIVASTLVVISPIDINDNPPVFTSDVYTVRVAEDVPIASNILQVCGAPPTTGLHWHRYVSPHPPLVYIGTDGGGAKPSIELLFKFDLALKHSRICKIFSRERFLGLREVSRDLMSF